MGSCRAGWLPFGQDCFQFNTNQTLYTGAKLDCEKKGGQLAVVLTSVQQTFLAMGIKATGSDSYIGKRAKAILILKRGSNIETSKKLCFFTASR